MFTLNNCKAYLLKQLACEPASNPPRGAAHQRAIFNPLTNPTMNHEIITHTPITLDNGIVVEAYIHKLPSGMYAMHADYPFTANSNPTRTRQIVDALFRSQHRDWFRFIRFQRSSTPLPMPTLNPTKP